MIKKIILAATTIVVLLIGTMVFVDYQKNKIDTEGRPGTKIVNLSQPSDSKIVVFETSDVIISIGLEDFKSNLTQFIERNPHIVSDGELLDFIEEKANNNNEINTNEASENLQQRIRYRVYDLLENGRLTIFDKKQGKYVDKIKVEPYGFDGREFILPDTDVIFLRESGSIVGYHSQ